MDAGTRFGGTPRVLLAATQRGLPVLRKLWRGHVQALPAASLPEAAKLLAQEIDVIVCTIHFHESRMFDLLRLAKSARPDTPFICCRVLHTRLEKHGIAAVRVAALAQGAAAYLDLPALRAEHGAARGDEVFREAVMSHCRKRVGSALSPRTGPGSATATKPDTSGHGKPK